MVASRPRRKTRYQQALFDSAKSQALRRLKRKEFQSSSHVKNWNESRMLILAHVARHAVIPTAVIAKKVGTDRANVLKTLHKFLASGWVDVERGGQKKPDLWKITELGLLVLKQVMNYRFTWNNREVFAPAGPQRLPGYDEPQMVKGLWLGRGDKRCVEFLNEARATRAELKTLGWKPHLLREVFRIRALCLIQRAVARVKMRGSAILNAFAYTYALLLGTDYNAMHDRGGRVRKPIRLTTQGRMERRVLAVGKQRGLDREPSYVFRNFVRHCMRESQPVSTAYSVNTVQFNYHD